MITLCCHQDTDCEGSNTAGLGFPLKTALQEFTNLHNGWYDLHYPVDIPFHQLENNRIKKNQIILKTAIYTFPKVLSMLTRFNDLLDLFHTIFHVPAKLWGLPWDVAFLTVGWKAAHSVILWIMIGINYHPKHMISILFPS